MTIGFLIPDLEYRHHARQVAGIVDRLQHLKVQTRVLALRGEGPLQSELPTDTVLPVIRGRRTIPPTGSIELYRWLNSAPPKLIHVWGKEALWKFSMAKVLVRKKPLWLFSPLIGEKLSAADRFLLAGCERILVPHPDFPGLTQSKSEFLPPIASTTTDEPIDAAVWDGPADAKIILIVGRLDDFYAFKDALWAFDMIRRIDSSLHLVILGDGPARNRLEDFQFCLAGTDSRVHFLGASKTMHPWLLRANLVWLPCDRRGGVHRVKEALSGNIPMIVPRLPLHVANTNENEFMRFYKPGRAIDLAQFSLELLESKQIQQKENENLAIEGTSLSDKISKIYC